MAAPLICPSILASDFARLGEEVAAIERAGADWVHVDVMDGHFVPNLTIGPDVVKALRPHTSLPFDVHLMVAPVDPWLEAYRAAGADVLSVHPESGPHLHRTLGRIRDLGAKAGVVFNPGTPLSILEEVVAFDPTRTPAYLNLADAYQKSGDKAKAKANYQKYAELMEKAGKGAKVPARVRAILKP